MIDWKQVKEMNKAPVNEIIIRNSDFFEFFFRNLNFIQKSIFYFKVNLKRIFYWIDHLFEKFYQPRVARAC